MHPDLETLARADALDRRRRQAKASLDAEQEGHRAAIQAVATGEVTLSERTDALSQARDAERALNRKLHQYRDRRASALRVLESGAGDASAAERQLAQCDEILDSTETEVLENLEVQDTLQRDLDQARATLEERRRALAELEGGVADRIAALEQSIAQLTTERDAVLATLDAQTRDRYHQLVARKGTAVSTIEGDACKACRMVVQPQHRVDLERGLIIPCRGCHRWLIP